MKRCEHGSLMGKGLIKQLTVHCQLKSVDILLGNRMSSEQSDRSRICERDWHASLITTLH